MRALECATRTSPKGEPTSMREAGGVGVVGSGAGARGFVAGDAVRRREVLARLGVQAGPFGRMTSVDGCCAGADGRWATVVVIDFRQESNVSATLDSSIHVWGREMGVASSVDGAHLMCCVS